MNVINVYTDGGSRGNPGPSAIGVYIVDPNGRQLFSLGERIGLATNNIAEYKAVIRALLWLLENKQINEKTEVNFFLDSKLICSQINGLYKVKNANLRNLIFEIREKEAKIKAKIKYYHIAREKNIMADKLVNLALDDDL